MRESLNEHCVECFACWPRGKRRWGLTPDTPEGDVASMGAARNTQRAGGVSAEVWVSGGRGWGQGATHLEAIGRRRAPCVARCGSACLVPDATALRSNPWQGKAEPLRTTQWVWRPRASKVAASICAPIAACAPDAQVPRPRRLAHVCVCAPRPCSLCTLWPPDHYRMPACSSLPPWPATLTSQREVFDISALPLSSHMRVWLTYPICPPLGSDRCECRRPPSVGYTSGLACLCLCLCAGCVV